MPERKSPPGPREIIQEHRFINSWQNPGFEGEVAPEPSPDGPTVQREETEDE